MAKNIKTIRRRFAYRQCDDFAAYLNHMARQGWHFKEWRAGLVFEKGEPENAVYAVEIFTDGTAHDMQPSYKAFNFAEYCEAAGWKLIDQREKWCVLKRTREDAVPIFTDEERFENVKNVTYVPSIKTSLLYLLFTVFAFFLYKNDPESILFKPGTSFIVYWGLLLTVQEIFHFINYQLWYRKCLSRLERGEVLYFRHRRAGILEWIIFLILPLLYYARFLNAKILGLRIFWIVTIIYICLKILLGCLPAQRRMDADSSRIVSLLSSILSFAYLFSVMIMGSSLAYQEDDYGLLNSSSWQDSYNSENPYPIVFYGSERIVDFPVENNLVRCIIYESAYEFGCGLEQLLRNR